MCHFLRVSMQVAAILPAGLKTFYVLIDSSGTAMPVACKYRAVVSVAVYAIVLSSLEVDAQ